MSWCCSDDVQASGETYAVLIGHSLERCLTLIMVHGQHTVEMVIGTASEEIIGSIGTKHLNALFCQFADGRVDNRLLLVAQNTILSTTGIQSQYGNARVGHAQVALQCLME